MLTRKIIPWFSVLSFLVFGGLEYSTHAQGPLKAGRSEHSECKNNPDNRYERSRLLSLFQETLERSVPAYKQFPHDGFFVFDLVDLENYFIPAEFARARSYIDFVEGRIYHFAPISLINSESHFAILSDGKVDIFESVNCDNGNTLGSLRARIEGLKMGAKQKRRIMNRLDNYRKFGYYVGVDEKNVRCN